MVPYNKRKKKKKVIPKNIQSEQKYSKKVRQDNSVGARESLTICWQLGKIDWKGHWGNLSSKKLDFRQLIVGLISHLETMTWAEIYGASGGRNRGNNHHPIEISSLSKKAKKRLKDIKLEDVDSIISLRINSRERLYGIRDGRALQLLWYDPWHDEPNKAVCSSSRS